MRKYNYSNHKFVLLSLVIVVLFTGCTKYGKGFLSPTLQYAVNQFTIKKGTVSSSYSIITDGSSIPLHIKWTHVYDASGKIVDTLFSKTYPVGIWTAAYNALTDTTYAKIIAKRATGNLQPIIVNESNGTLQSNSGTIYLPSGTYTMDLEVSNIAGTEKLDKIISIILQDGQPLETTPEIGNFSNSLLIANTATGATNGTLFNGVNNPFVDYTVTRLADTPNLVVLKVYDRNGVPFNPKTGEFTKRPNSGLNPTPPFLQNLQDYAPDTFVASDSAISLKYPLTPFPINSLGNGYNMYYRIPTQYVHIDSTTTWSSNTAGNLYKGTADSHYKGVYKDNQFDYALRIPMRVQVPGSYEIRIKILNTVHR